MSRHVLWSDGDASLGKTADRNIGDQSKLLLDLDAAAKKQLEYFVEHHATLA